MSACLKSSILQAFADGELPKATIASAATHIEPCASCRRELEKIRAANLETRRLLDSLLPEQAPEVMPSSVRAFSSEPAANPSRTIVATIGALAACALLVFILLHRQVQPPSLTPSTASNASSASQPASQVAAMQPALAIAKSPAIQTSNPIRHAARKIRPLSQPLEFFPLDDGGPIESGMIVRVNLGASVRRNSLPARGAKQVPVDVLLDEQGEVRAIRFVNGGSQ